MEVRPGPVTGAVPLGGETVLLRRGGTGSATASVVEIELPGLLAPNVVASRSVPHDHARPMSDDPAVVQSWFEHEASIRDPAAKDFTIRPLIREKTLRYLAARSPSRHLAMLTRAAAVQSTPPET